MGSNSFEQRPKKLSATDMGEDAEFEEDRESGLLPFKVSVVSGVREIDPALALGEDELDRLLDPTPLEAERGCCFRGDGVGYVAMRVEMPDVTGEMVEWWFDWHPDDPARYVMWHPTAHKGISIERPAQPREKPWWGTVHHPVEDVGIGTTRVRIEFLSPDELGFSPGAMERRGVATIVGGLAGDDDKRARHTRMVHVWLDDPATGGTILRSRFWIGSVLRPYMPQAIAGPAARLINRPSVRKRLIPRGAPAALANHCAEEYTNLAGFLPALFAQERSAAARG
ncbi:MAG: hypothetical protein QM648_08420 [Solirubrobacterales bacterium]